MGEVNFGTQEVKMVDRSNISITGVNKIVSFDDEEFLMETVMGNLRILGNGLELLKLDTVDGNVKIKGKINSFMYIEGKTKNKEESIITKLFKWVVMFKFYLSWYLLYMEYVFTCLQDLINLC